MFLRFVVGNNNGFDKFVKKLLKIVCMRNFSVLDGATQAGKVGLPSICPWRESEQAD